MTEADVRKQPLRERLLPMLREVSGVPASARTEVPFGNLRLPAWRFDAERAPLGTAVIFGGFDSYIEEFFPMFTYAAGGGHRHSERVSRQAYQSRGSSIEDSLAGAFAARTKKRSAVDAKSRMLAGVTLAALNATIASWFTEEQKSLPGAASRMR